MFKYIGVALGGLVAGVLIGLLLVGGGVFGAASGTYHTQTEEFVGGFYVGDSGTTVSKYKCYTATFNPDSISSTTVATTKAFLTPNATVGDVIVATLNSVTSTNQWFVEAKVTAGSGTATATTTLYMRSLEGAAVDISTSTAKVCVLN